MSYKHNPKHDAVISRCILWVYGSPLLGAIVYLSFNA